MIKKIKIEKLNQKLIETNDLDTHIINEIQEELQKETKVSEIVITGR